jgi:hypothetical protein
MQDHVIYKNAICVDADGSKVGCINMSKLDLDYLVYYTTFLEPASLVFGQSVQFRGLRHRARVICEEVFGPLVSYPEISRTK